MGATFPITRLQASHQIMHSATSPNPTRLEVSNASLLLTAGFAVLSVITFFNGYNPGVQIWGDFHWLITYDHGLIRRGAVGTIFQYFYGDLKLAPQRNLIVQINLVLSFGIILALSLWLCRLTITSRDRNQLVALLTIGGLFATSQLMPTLAYNTGYLDVVLYLLFVLAMIAAVSGHQPAAALIGTIAPFVHESFIFLWPPVALILLQGATLSKRDFALKALYCSAPLIGTLLVIFAHDQNAAVAEVMSLPLKRDIKQGILQSQLGQSTSGALRQMVHTHLEHWPTQLWAALFFCAPAMAMLLVYTALRINQLRPYAWLILIPSFLSPLAILAFAWDLSRFLVAVNLTTLTGILALETKLRDVPGARPWPAIAGWCLIVTAVFSPFIYAYFGSAAVISNGVLRFEHASPTLAVRRFAEDVLSFPRGAYLSSCTEVTFSKNILKASCKTADGNLTASELNISECISPVENSDGRLTCRMKAPSAS
jgi:hypothetical protein